MSPIASGDGVLVEFRKFRSSASVAVLDGDRENFSRPSRMDGLVNTADAVFLREGDLRVVDRLRPAVCPAKRDRTERAVEFRRDENRSFHRVAEVDNPALVHDRT